MPKERKEDYINDADSENLFDRDRVSSHKVSQKKTKATKKSPSKSQRSPSGSNLMCIQKDVCFDIHDPKVQTAMLVGLLAIMAVALWYGFTQGCFRTRRRRTCWLVYYI